MFFIDYVKVVTNKVHCFLWVCKIRLLLLGVPNIFYQMNSYITPVLWLGKHKRTLKRKMKNMLVISILTLFCFHKISTIPVLKTASRTEEIFISTAEILNSDLSEVAEFTICLRVMSHQFSDRYQGLLWIPSNKPFPLWLGTIPAPCNYMTSKTMLYSIFYFVLFYLLVN